MPLVAYRDTWPDAQERWWDIGSHMETVDEETVTKYNQYNAWITNGASNGQFNYASRAANVRITYEKAPLVPYFVGHVSATGLKPNFAYQVKLTGKPVFGTRGTGTRQSYVTASSKLPDATRVYQPVSGTPVNGDDWTNQQLGYAGRWWNDSNASGNTNAVTDGVYQRWGASSANKRGDTIYGYLFMGSFVTDAQGNAETDIVGNNSYHVTWQDWQTGDQQHVEGPGPHAIEGHSVSASPVSYYGYGAKAPSSGLTQANGKTPVTLWYEYEGNGRPRDNVILKPGTYHCKILITEESFHNNYGYTSGTLGGKWKTVMATEEFGDTVASNDLVFTISAPPATTSTP